MKAPSSVLGASYPCLVLLLVLVIACGGGDDEPMGMTNGKPVAAIVALPMEVPESEINQTIVTLDGSTSSDPDNDPLTFTWNVSNGTFENLTSASSMIAQVGFAGADPVVVPSSVCWGEPRVALVTLTVDDGNGNQDSAEETICVE